MDITIHIPELDKLSDSINHLAEVTGKSFLKTLTIGPAKCAETAKPANPTPAATLADTSTNTANFAPQTPASIPDNHAQAIPTNTVVNPTQTAPTAPVTTSSVPGAATAPVAPTTVPQYSLDQLQAAAVTLVDTGKRDAVIALFPQFGVQTIYNLPLEQYGAFATALRGLGAAI